MGGMPSARGIEWKNSGESRKNFDDNYKKIPRVSYCVQCADKHNLNKRWLETETGDCGLCGGKSVIIVGSVFQDTAEKLKKEL